MNTLLESYLAEVKRRLSGLSEVQREQEITEIRLHLEAAIASSREAGLPEEAATASAIRQFGDARTIARRLHAAHWRGFLRRLDTPLTLLPLNVLLLMTVYPLCNALIGGVMWFRLLVTGETAYSACRPTAIAASWLIGMGLPWATGWLLGRVFPKYGPLTAFVGCLCAWQILYRLPPLTWHVVPGYYGVTLTGHPGPVSDPYFLQTVPTALNLSLFAWLGKHWSRRFALSR